MKNWQVAAIAIVSLTAVALMEYPTAPKSEYQLWKQEYGVKFAPEHEGFRQILFFESQRAVQRHNADPSKSYKLGINQFSHLSDQEFAPRYMSYSYYKQENYERPADLDLSEVQPLEEIDWQSLGKVSAVKDQGVCDAGYAFCSSSLMESYYLLNNQNVTLSEQQIIDCSADYTTFGCQGGSRNGTLIYIREKGLTTGAQYSYKGVKRNCQKENGQYKPAYTHIEYNGCTDIMNGLYKAPMTVAVNAKDWRQYKSGIFDGCTSTEVNHDTYLIGANQGYWRIKNSWGLRWGEYGYIRLKSGNTCGICEKPGFSFKI